MVQRTHAPHVSAHIREYFAQGARKFGIHALVEVLPTLLLSSVMLFFAGLVVFAFRANNVVAYITLAIVSFCSLSYITLTLIPLFFHDCPYQTPPTTLIWYFAQIVLLLLSYAAHHCAKGLQRLGRIKGSVTDKTVKSLKLWHESKARSISEGIFSEFENSAKRTSMDIYRAALSWTLSLIDEDRELEEFVSGIPGLRESEALAPYNDVKDPRRTIRAVLAVLPGPTSFHAPLPLPWSIVRLADRAIASNLSEPIGPQRIKSCLRALYYIPGAIRDLLAPYAAKKFYCLQILPLLNTVESLEIIDELWDTPRDDVALSVRCAAAVVYSFMITPPRRELEVLLPRGVSFIGNTQEGKQFLSRRLVGADPGADVLIAPDSELHSDNARLQNLARFLKDIKTMLGYINMPWWETDSAQSIYKERHALSVARNTEKYRTGEDIFEQHGHRASAAFIPAVQQDLIALTFEILRRDPVAGAAPSHCEALRDAYEELLEVARAQMPPQPPDQSMVQSLALSLEQSFSPFWGRSLPRPLTQALGLALAHPLVQSRTASLAQYIAQLRVPSRPEWLTPSLLRPLPQFLAQCFSPSWPQSLPQFLAQSLPLSLPLAHELAPSGPSSAQEQDMVSGVSGRTQEHVVGDVEMATLSPQRLVEGVDARPQTEDQPTVHDSAFPSTAAMPQAASAGPSRLSSSVASSSSSLPRGANSEDRGLSDSADALV